MNLMQKKQLYYTHITLFSVCIAQILPAVLYQLYSVLTTQSNTVLKATYQLEV